jgi:hypothetical protein
VTGTNVAVLPKRQVATAERPALMLDLIEQLASDEALAAAQKVSEAYDRACRALLSKNDVVDVGGGREAKNKSAWRKLGRHFYISTELVSEKHDSWADVDEDGIRHLNATVCVRAEAPWGQTTEAVGGCSTREDRFYTTAPLCPVCDGPTWDNRYQKGEPAWRRKLRDEGKTFTCRNRGCPGYIDARAAFVSLDPEDAKAQEDQRELQRLLLSSKPNPTARARAFHDVLATAQTRATNRAISDLIAAGEVSYEELETKYPQKREPEDLGDAETEDEAVNRMADDEATKPDPAVLNYQVQFEGPHRGKTWGMVVEEDPDFVATVLGRKGESAARIEGEKMVASLSYALEHLAPATEDQMFTLKTLNDEKSFEGQEVMQAWVGEVLSGRVNRPRYARMEEALLKVGALPSKNVEPADPEDDLPF